ncbi:unnamed protein product [Paramecium octaurelia]|uniref:Guanylate cyclase domain-containing protein n=1 Tax=Paramecium octaurelia TaxID=43137 RepID=A0A8S1U8X5_PAROT|nr:unnamed protein product [Paramecium octaurelia]
MKILFWLISRCYLWLPRKIQKSVQKSLLLQQGIDQTQKIEFSNGEVQKITNFEIATNNIKLISIKTLIVIFIEKIISVENIIILGILIIALSGQTYTHDQNEEIIVYYTLFCYLFKLLLSLMNTSIIAFQRKTQQNTINSQQCTIIAKFPDVSSKQLSNLNIELHSYEKITWSQLKVGHIICLQQNEQSPADLLILDSSKEQVLINFDQRTPCSCTFVSLNQTIKGNILDFKTKLSGTIQFTVTDLTIQGTIKLKNDPKLTPFTKKNMIQRGERLNSVDWIFGMVIRVGNDCIAQSNFYNENFKPSSWIHKVYQKVILILIVLFLILLVPNIIFYSFQSYEKYFYSSICYSLLIIPQNLLWLNQFWLLINMVKNNNIFNKYKNAQNVQQNSMNRLLSEINENQVVIISENEKKVLLPIQKQFKINLLPIQQTEIQLLKKKKDNFKGFLTLSKINILDMIKGDMILLDNPQEIFKNKPQIMQIITKDQKQYLFNYQKLQELVKKASPTLKTNYEKLLIDTNRQQTNDEQKTQDLEVLLAEKKVPNLRNSNEGLYQIKKLQLASREELVNKTLLGTQKQQLPKKKSTRYIFDQSFAKKSLDRVDSMKDLSKLNNSTPSSLQKQRSQFFGKGGTLIKQYNNNSSLQVSPTKQNEDQGADRLIGDYYNEQDFIDCLYKKDDTLHNEILLMILITNNILSVFDDQTRELQFNFGNKFDESLLEFTKVFNYQLLCSTEIENSRLDYKLKSYIKKVISIENQVKVFEVLAFLEPTEKRKNTLSVLVRDPESFLLEEGSILYTRIQTTELKNVFKGKNDPHNKQPEYYSYYNEQLQELLWDGQSTFVYSKRQLSQDQTQEFLQKLSQLHDAYGNRSQEIEIEYQKLEQQNEILFCIGIRSGNHHNTSQISQNEFQMDALKEEKLFQTLQMQNIKICLTTSESYDELIIFLRSHQVVQKEQIVHFYERDVQQLQYRFRQHIQYMLEEQDIMGSDVQQHLEKYIIISKESFKIILQDDYLKYHFVFMTEFASGLGAYQFTGKCNGQLVKLLKLNKKKVISIGNSLQNNYLFNKSDISFTLTQNNPFFCITQPNFVVRNIKQVFQLFYFYCTQYLQNYISFLEIQVYRSTLIGLSVFGINLYQSDINLFNLMIFFLVPSNISTFIFQSYLLINQVDYDQKYFNSLTKRLTILKTESIVKQLIKIIIIAIFDSALLIIVEKALLHLTYGDGKINQTNQIVLLYTGIEVLEKSKLLFIVFDAFNDILYKIKQLLIIISLTFILSICYLIVQSIEDNQEISLQFNNPGLQVFIFMAAFLVGLSFVLKLMLQIINVDFSFPIDNSQLEIHMKEINNIKQNLNSDTNEKGYFQNIKKMIETLFENKDIVDEQITKFIKVDQTTIDYMDKNHGFYDRRTENDFMDFFRQQNWQKYSLSYVFVFYEGTIFISHLYEIMMNDFSTSILIVIIIQLMLQLLIVIFQFKFINNKTSQQYLQIVSFGLRFIFKILIDLLYLDERKEFTAFLYHTLFSLSFALTTQPKINIYLYAALQLLMYLFELVLDGFSIKYDNINEAIFCSFKYFFIIIAISYPIFNYIQKIQFLQRSSYVYQNRLSKEQKKINRVLGLLMPRFIQERMNKGQIQISQDQGDVSVLFCDIYQFDKVIKDQQEKIIEFLDTLYRAFDQLCQNYDLQKIETVGKTYMAAGGLKDYDVVINQKNANSTSRALETAIQMMETVKTMKYGDNQDVQLKIGIHFGRVIAGVIGVHKPQFSLIGDTVNTTSRVCSTGEAGFITLSEAAYLHVKDNTKYQFEKKSVAAKGKGMIETYKLILQQKESTRILTPKVSTSEYQDKNSIQSKEPRKIMNFKSSTDKKNIFKRPSVQPAQIGALNLNDHAKSPKVVIRQLHRETQSSIMPNMILKKKPSIENDLESKRLNSIKSKSFNQNDDVKDNNHNSNAKTPGFQKNWIQKRQSAVEEKLPNFLAQPNNQQDSITQIQFQVDSKPQVQAVSQSCQQQLFSSGVNLSHQSNQQQFLHSADQLLKVTDQQVDNNKQEGLNFIPRPQMKKKGTIILGELIQKKGAIIKSSTKIILPEERDKNQIVKVSGVGVDSDSQMEQKKQLKNQRSLKLQHLQDSSSALKKSPESMNERLEELEIAKKKLIITPEQKFDYQTNQKNANSTSRALETAIQMMETVKTMKYGDNQDVQLKIGIHFGRVIAGVIGVHKPQFSLIGDTVNTTSRVCSTGEAGFITLSEAAYLHVKDNTKYQFEKKSVAAKGKGMIETYKLILQQKESTRILTPKVSTSEYQDKNSIQSKEPRKIMNFKSSTDKKNIFKRPSVQPAQIGALNLNDHAKSPKVVIRQLHRETQSSIMPNMILKKKPSIENDLESKRLNSIKSKSFNQNDDVKDNNHNSNAKTPGFQKNWIQKRQSAVEEKLPNFLAQPNNQQDSITQIQFQVDSKPQVQAVSQSCQQQLFSSGVNLSHQSNQQQFLHSADQLLKVTDQQVDNNKQEGLNFIPRPQMKKKGTIILGELIQKKGAIIKSSTKIILPEERDKNQIVKVSGVGVDSDSQMEQKKQLKNQRSLKLQHLQDSSSALKKSPESMNERLEELEIAKKKLIITPEQKFDYQTLETIKKFKLDYDEKSTFEIDNSQFKTNDQQLYHSIYEEYKEQEKLQMRNILVFLTTLNLFKGLLLFIISQQFNDTQIQLLVVQVCQFGMCLILTISYQMILERVNLEMLKIIIWIYFLGSSSLSLLIINFEKKEEFEVVLQTISISVLYINVYLSQILNYEDRQRFIAMFIIVITIMIVYEAYILELLIYLMGISGLTFFCQMQEKDLLFKNYLISLQLSTQIAKYENMLQYLMPPHALRRLLNPDQENTDTFMDVLENTTVLFADIAGFTKYSSSVEPETVVDMLRNLFSNFDEYCQKAEIYKLFTIGDCYVCMGVLDCKKRDPAGEAQKVLAFGFSMIEIINHYKKDPQYQHLNMRIGVHTGRVLGGVVGTDVVRYDIYGEDVTIANLMESSGQEGKILVSEITKNLVESEYEGFQFDYAKDVYLPSKNLTISTYYVSPSDVEYSQND